MVAYTLVQFELSRGFYELAFQVLLSRQVFDKARNRLIVLKRQ
jgi:hypothetical protein